MIYLKYLTVLTCKDAVLVPSGFYLLSFMKSHHHFVKMVDLVTSAVVPFLRLLLVYFIFLVLACPLVS